MGSYELVKRKFSGRFNDLGFGCDRLLHLRLEAKGGHAAGWRRCDDGSVIFYRERVADVAGLHRLDGGCLLAGETRILISGIETAVSCRNKNLEAVVNFRN